MKLVAAAALSLSFGASIPCDAPPGMVVARVLMSGGSAQPITYRLSGGDTADFRIRGSVIVVGVNGIDPARCGTNQKLTVTATQ